MRSNQCKRAFYDEPLFRLNPFTLPLSFFLLPSCFTQIFYSFTNTKACAYTRMKKRTDDILEQVKRKNF